jgi:isoquinoline 1-oxidoreductase beta subunit
VYGRVVYHGRPSILTGIAVQPDNIVAQTESSIVYGLGLALTERISFKDGMVQQSNFYDYRVPRLRDVPEMHIKLMPTPNPPTGVGQMATPLVAPAIASAVRCGHEGEARAHAISPRARAGGAPGVIAGLTRS